MKNIIKKHFNWETRINWFSFNSLLIFYKFFKNIDEWTFKNFIIDVSLKEEYSSIYKKICSGDFISAESEIYELENTYEKLPECSRMRALIRRKQVIGK